MRPCEKKEWGRERKTGERRERKECKGRRKEKKRRGEGGGGRGEKAKGATVLIAWSAGKKHHKRFHESEKHTPHP